MHTPVALTNSLNVTPGSHILYFYSSLAGYIENAASYILTGLELGQHVVFIDSEERYRMVLGKLGAIDKGKIHYVNNFDFYEMYHDFHFERVLTNLQNIVAPYLESERVIRLWGHVDWTPQENMLSKLHTYECRCDITIAELGYTTVCAYDSQTVPANIMLEMLKSHEYVMTDEELVHSNLYKTSNQHNPAAFPSLSAQAKIESEMDLYKQKLDFVHVVSHEVRNPLTVIKAYATLLGQEEQCEQRKAKLDAIKNYAMVIDSEISHVITTEQMLSTDALWQKKLIHVNPAIAEVIDIMRIKAQTQNIFLQTNVRLNGAQMILSNLIGFKMILSNLLSNAIKYSGEGGVVSLDIFKEDERLLFKVRDKGVGMSAEQLAKLYKKYEKTNQEQSGQGIGLFMVKKLVDHFDGDIAVESEINVGTTFVVRLPICK